MRTRRLGRQGPEVSVVGLGCNNFGRRIDRGATRAVVDAALEPGSRSSTPPTSTADGASEELLGAALAGRRERAVVATKFGHADPRRPGRAARLARLDALRRRRLAAAAADRPDRPLPLPRPDGTTPLAGDDRRAGRARARGQCALPRRLERLAAAGRAGCPGSAGGKRPARQRPERVQPARRGPEAELLPSASGSGSEFSPISRSRAACSRGSTGETRRRPRARAWPRATIACATTPSTGSRRSSASPRHAASHCSRSRSAVLPPSRPSHPSSPARRPRPGARKCPRRAVGAEPGGAARAAAPR